MDFLSLLLLAILVAIAYIQTIQGFFSSLLMCILTLICAALAMTTFEWLALTLLLEPLGDLALPAALVGAFVIPLALLRVALDIWAPRAPLIPVLIDRVAAAALGIVTGFVMTGVLALAIQMTPFGGSFIGHDGLVETSGSEARTESHLWLNPDRFVVGYASMMSNGLFSGGRDWEDIHPDFVQEIIWAHAVPRGVRIACPPGAIRVQQVQEPDYVFTKTPGDQGRDAPPQYERSNPPPGQKWYQVRLSLEDGTADTDGQYRFNTRQARLVGRDRPGEPLKNYRAVAVDDSDDPNVAVFVPETQLLRPSSASNWVDFVFPVPQSFEPSFVEFKMGPRADLSNVEPVDVEAQAVAAGSPTSASTPPPPAPPAETSRSAPEDRVSGARGRGSESRFSDALPVAMTNYEAFDLEQRGGAMGNGHVWGRLADQGQAGSQPELSRFAVPSGKRMFQLDVEQLHAVSTLGRALNFAVQSVKNYQLHDDSGRVYLVVGQFAVASVGGEDIVEIQYFPEAVEAAGRGGMRDFQRIRSSHLRGSNYRLCFLFLVEPGARLTEFTTGAGRRPTDLGPLDLVVP